LKTFLTVIITALVLVGSWWGYRRLTDTPDTAIHKDPIVVRVEPALRGELIEVVNAPGSVEPKNKASISAKVEARVVEIPHQEGEHVTKGNPNAKPPIPPSVLVRLDDRDLQAALRSSKAHYAAQEAELQVAEQRIASGEASLTVAKVTLADNERDLKRQQGLLASKDVSQSIVDTAAAKVDEQRAQLLAQTDSLEADRTNIQALRHTLDAAQADIARAEEDVSNTVITSPIDGTITTINSHVGEMVVIGVTNSPGTTIMEVADLNEMLMRARLDESAIASVHKGLKASVFITAYPDETFTGEVTNVALAETEEKEQQGTKYFKADIALHTNGRIIPSGLTADADIETHRHDGVMSVLSQAVLGRPVDELPESVRSLPEVDKTKTLTTVVYRLINGKTVVTPVSIGASDATRTIIKSGLHEGDLVVVGPFKTLDTLQDGVAAKTNQTTTQPATRAAVAGAGSEGTN
jgi:HlyD family secretion protein